MQIRQFNPDDEAAVIELWRRCDLLRPWNDPHLDIQHKLKQHDGLFLVGLIEGLATPFMPVSWTPIIEFALFVVTLIAFPRGIFAFSRA